MPDSTRLLVQKRLTALFETIEYTDFDSTEFDMAGRVYRGRTIFGSESLVPMISILEAPIPNDSTPSPRGGTASQQNWELVVQGFVRDDRQNPTDPAHMLMAEVKRILALERKKQNWDKPEQGILQLGRTIDDIVIGSGVVRPSDELSSKAFFWLVLTVKMVEDLSDPYGGQ